MSADPEYVPKVAQALAFPDPNDLAARLVASLPNAVMALDGEGIIRSANPRAEEFMAQSASQLNGMPLAALLMDDIDLASILDRVATGEGAFSTRRLSFKCVGGARTAQNFWLGPVDGSDWFLLTFVTEDGHAPENDRPLEWSASVSAVLAHEIKNPLAGVRGAAQLLSETAEGKDLKLLTLIQEESDRICLLLDRVEALGDPVSERREPVNIHKILDHVILLAGVGLPAEIRISRSYDPSLPPVLADSDQLKQIFLNLLQNAGEAVPPENGRIDVTTSFAMAPPIIKDGEGKVLAAPITITIRDNGPGVDTAQMQRLFDPLYSEKPGHKGLGLSITAKLVAEHNGQIAFERCDYGAMVAVHLPVHTEARPA